MNNTNVITWAGWPPSIGSIINHEGRCLRVVSWAAALYAGEPGSLASARVRAVVFDQAERAAAAT